MFPRPPPGDLPDPGIEPATQVSCIGRRVFSHGGRLGSPLSFLEGAKLCLLSQYLVSLPSFFFVCFVFLSFSFFSSYFLALLLVILLWIWVSQSLMDTEELGRGRAPGSPVPGILQARTLEWVAISFSNA